MSILKPSFPSFDRFRINRPAGRLESVNMKALRSRTCRGFASLRESHSTNWIPACTGMTAQRGFSIVTAIFLLVVLSFLGVAMVTFSAAQHQSSALDVMGSRAYQAARAGIDWAAYQVATSPVSAPAAAACATNFAAGSLGGTLSPFTVTVNCVPTAYIEGASTIWIYDVIATACADPVCPNPAPGPNYIERMISVKLGR